MSHSPDPLVGARPIHTRSLDVEVRAGDRGSSIWEARGELVDLRKGGFVPVAADLQTAGLLHHMRVAAQFDADRRTLVDVSAEQPAVAFEASRLSEGESCRDPVARLGALAGVELATGWDHSLLDAIGGPRGCSHVLALARLVGATLAWLTSEAGVQNTAADWRPGERIFHRSLCFDCTDRGEEGFALQVQLIDLHFKPTPEVVRPMERFERQTDVRGQALVGRGDLALHELQLARRERGLANLERARWEDVGATLAQLQGVPVARGMRRRVLEALPDEAPGAPLVAALLDLAPAVLQCLASDCEPWPARAAGDTSLVVSGGLPDSCWMWRGEGALARARAREQDPPQRKR